MATITPVNSPQAALDRSHQTGVILIAHEAGCPHCRAAFEKINQSEFPLGWEVLSWEASKNPEELVKLGLHGVPAFLIALKGKFWQSLTALASIDELFQAMASAAFKQDRAELSRRLESILETIENSCRKSGRAPRSVRLLLATKTVPPERLRAVASLGHVLFGENKAQELLEKAPALKDIDIQWHFIGHLQSNKVKSVIGPTAMIHSVGRLPLAQEISKRAVQCGKTCQILVEVNTSDEASKSGVAPDQAIDLCRQISSLPGVEIHGLMTLAKESSQEEVVRACFRKLRELSDAIRAANIPGVKMDELSMGMSQDYQIAIEEGSTLVRIGSAIFGRRMT